MIEATTSLSNPTWLPLQTNTLNGNSLYFQRPELDQLSEPLLSRNLAVRRRTGINNGHFTCTAAISAVEAKSSLSASGKSK